MQPSLVRCFAMRPQTQPTTGHERILLVTIDEMLAKTLTRLLKESSFDPVVAHDVASGLDACRRACAVLILVDRHVSSMDELVRHPACPQVPVIVIESPEKDCREDDCIEDLFQGFDGSLCKQSYPELMARIRAVLRREHQRFARQTQYVCGFLCLNVERHEVTVEGKPIDLTPKEFKILQNFLEHPGKAFSRDELLDQIWGEEAALEQHTLDVHIHSLRQKIESDPTHPRYIVTVRGVGYKLTDR
jgi:two-component system response regulator RegX3